MDIKDSKISNIKAIKNVGYSKDSGAGISAAEQIGKLGVDVLITGDVGPKAAGVLEQLEIKVCKKSGIARAAVSEYLNDDISQADKIVLSEDSGTQKDGQTIKDQRIFIPLMDDNGEDSEISLHFGHAPYFGLYDTAEKKLKDLSQQGSMFVADNFTLQKTAERMTGILSVSRRECAIRLAAAVPDVVITAAGLLVAFANPSA